MQQVAKVAEQVSKQKMQEFMQPEPPRSRYRSRKNLGQYSELSSIPPSPRMPIPTLETPKLYNHGEKQFKYNLNPYLNLDELPAAAPKDPETSLNYEQQQQLKLQRKQSNEIWHKPENQQRMNYSRN